MKRLSLLFALSFVLLSFGLANSASHMVFSIHPQSGMTFVHPTFPGNPTYYKGNTDMYIDFNVLNDGDASNSAYVDPLRFYGKIGGIETNGVSFTWVPVVPPVVTTYKDGGMTIDNSWKDNAIGCEPLNGYATGLMNFLDTVVVRPGWATGGLPDTMSYAGTSTAGLPRNLDLPRIRFHFNVPVSGDDVVEICVDSSGYPAETQYDWVFDEPSVFGGPYCFEFARVPNLPPEVVTSDVAKSVAHHVNFNLTYPVTDPEGDPITGVGAVDQDNNPLGTATFTSGNINWVYNPPCSWVTDGISHKVKLYATDASHAYPTVSFKEISLTVTNSAPVIAGDCDQTVTVGINQTKFANFSATDANGVADSKAWSIAAVPEPEGAYDVVDGLVSFSPTNADADQDFVFTVTVTDCAGAHDECDVTFHVISELPFKIVIEAENGGTAKAPGDGVYLGHHAYVDVTQTEGSEHNLGFDFLIAYDNSALAFMGAYGNPELFDIPGQYEWEYFTYRFVNNCGGSCPSGLLQVVAIADQNDGGHSPLITLLPPDFLLFTMDFMVSNDYTLECSFVPISFFWRDCSDNSIAMHKRSDPPLVVMQAISKDVFGYNGTYFSIFNPTYGWPTYFGAQEECFNLQGDKANIDFIYFYNGGIKIICSDDIDARGDINLNGVDNEIADAVVFTNYFIYGLSAFTINVEGQKAATDVNADGIPLSVADLVYLIRIVVGDVLPIPKLTPNLVEANFGHNGQLVTVDAELGAALFVFEGIADVQLASDASHMQMKSGVVNGNTNVLVYSFDRGASCSGNILNTNGTLLSVEAADYNGSALKTVMVPTSFSVKSYPNPFNPVANIEMALPVATNWNVTIYNVAGQKVAEYAGFAEAGITNVVWDASASASGIYFYKVSTDSGSMTKKMVLLK